MFFTLTSAQFELPVCFLEASSVLGSVALQQRLVGDLPRIPEGRVPPSAGIQADLLVSLRPLVIFSWRLLLVSGRMEMRSGLSGV